MKKLLSASCALVMTASIAASADYNYIDPGDVYYINDWGADNRRVMVVRKLGNNMVKVRDATTGEATSVRASELLTRSQLNAEETENAVVGTAVGVAIMVCMLSPETCQNKK